MDKIFETIFNLMYQNLTEHHQVDNLSLETDRQGLHQGIYFEVNGKAYEMRVLKG